MPSVKDLEVAKEPSASSLGVGTFVFSDAYSVFDWGRMPDDIPSKGATLCSMGAGTFEALAAEGVPTHYMGVGDPGNPHTLASVEEPPTRMSIELTTVPSLPFSDGSYDYDSYHAEAEAHYLIPLEIVFRNHIPIGSSLRRRSEPSDLDLDYIEWPDHTVDLAVPLVEFSTKFEEADRYLDPAEADRIAGRADIAELRSLARTVNDVITQQAATAGLEHLDGKIECLYDDGTIKVADVAGTLDENRFAFEGQQLSKEVVRQFYRRTDSEWVDAVSIAKAEAGRTGVADWRDLCDRSPTPLPPAILEIVANMYQATANTYLDRHLFDVPPLTAVAADLRRMMRE